ncbi:hypothetical protein MPLA_1930017 [Mesorhizobium sp. ORS 3359]|nr:hypothetical protein MPLA_1930017 [Mesorhizobium sp. ORS 3359]
MHHEFSSMHLYPFCVRHLSSPPSTKRSTLAVHIRRLNAMAVWKAVTEMLFFPVFFQRNLTVLRSSHPRSRSGAYG